MNTHFQFLFLQSIHFFCIFWIIFPIAGAVAANPIEFPSSFNPVGSGARAMGMGGAFIAVADDATAASWNPAGLLQLKLPEASFVILSQVRYESNDFPGSFGSEAPGKAASVGINHASLVFPFQAFRRNQAVAVTRQCLYDFSRGWRFQREVDGSLQTGREDWTFDQSGALSALGLSWAIQIHPALSAGITCNLWGPAVGDNTWRQSYHAETGGTLSGQPFSGRYDKTIDYTFRGVNAHIGLLWRIRPNVAVGLAAKTPFTADIFSRRRESTVWSSEAGLMDANRTTRVLESEDELTLPLSLGIGLAYDIDEDITVSTDVHRTWWNDCVYRTAAGKTTNPFTGKPPANSNIQPTTMIRAGMEYRHVDRNRRSVVPFRFGVFVDSAPAPGSPDPYYGVNLGFGFTKNRRFSLDFAYQYRQGNDVGETLAGVSGFTQTVREHLFYGSLILYWSHALR